MGARGDLSNYQELFPHLSPGWEELNVYVNITNYGGPDHTINEDLLTPNFNQYPVGNVNSDKLHGKQPLLTLPTAKPVGQFDIIHFGYGSGNDIYYIVIRIQIVEGTGVTPSVVDVDVPVFTDSTGQVLGTFIGKNTQITINRYKQIESRDITININLNKA